MAKPKWVKCTRCEQPRIGLCCLCDESYCRGHEVEHSHPEPQSGPPRDAWIKSGLPYLEWIEETPEGIEWNRSRQNA